MGDGLMGRKSTYSAVSSLSLQRKSTLPDLQARACKSTYCGTCNRWLAKAHVATLMYRGVQKRLFGSARPGALEVQQQISSPWCGVRAAQQQKMPNAGHYLRVWVGPPHRYESS
eukprot:gene7900-biopygen7586